MNWFSHWDEWLEYLDSNGVRLEEVIDEGDKKVLSFAYKKVTEDEINELFGELEFIPYCMTCGKRLYPEQGEFCPQCGQKFVK